MKMGESPRVQDKELAVNNNLFLNPDRISMPDIDLDFEDSRREEVIEYCRQKYGNECVSRIITFGRMAAKNAVIDMCRVYDYPIELGRKISKLIPGGPKVTLESTMKESVDFRQLYNTDPDAKFVIDIAMKVEGLIKSTGVHACFDADTLVTTTTGLKKIVDVTIGDMVLTHENRFKPVVDTMITETDNVYKLKVSAACNVEVTGNHPMYVREMFTDGYGQRHFKAPMWKPVSELTPNKDYVGIAVNQNAEIPVWDNLETNSTDFWWIVGRFLGDGWTEEPKRSIGTNHREQIVAICCSKKNTKELEEITTHLNTLNYHYKVNEVNTTYKIFLRTHETLFHYLNRFGKYAHGKKLTPEVFNLPADLLKAFLDGYMSADGSYDSKINAYCFKTVSKELAIGMMQVVNKVYHRPVGFTVIPEMNEVIEGRLVHSKTKYECRFHIDSRKREKSFYEDGYIWSRVKSVSCEEDYRKMYNLTVLDDSSYTANGLIAHNCGTIISDQDISNYAPEIFVQNSETGNIDAVAGFTMGELEEIGALKMDFLGLRTESVINESLKDVARIYGKHYSLYDIPLNDVAVYEHLSGGHTAGAFQLESAGMTGVITQMYQDLSEKIADIRKNVASDKQEAVIQALGDQCFERLCCAISLYRPGPMDEIPHYIEAMLDESKIKYDTPGLEPILKNTYGVLVYQEQVMQAVKALAGFTSGQADLIRKAMGWLSAHEQ